MLAKKAKCWKTAINASSGAKHRFPIEGKKFFPADVLRAFANTHGGDVLIGVQDDSAVVGQQISDDMRFHVMLFILILIIWMAIEYSPGIRTTSQTRIS